MYEGLIHIERAVRAGDGYEVTSPKSDAGTRDVAIPPHLVPVLQAHLETHVGIRGDALLFPAKHGGHLAPAMLYRRFYTARTAAGRRSPVPRPTAQRCRAGRADRCHARRVDGAAWSFHPAGRYAIPARGTGKGPADCGGVVTNCSRRVARRGIPVRLRARPFW